MKTHDMVIGKGRIMHYNKVLSIGHVLICFSTDTEFDGYSSPDSMNMDIITKSPLHVEMESGFKAPIIIKEVLVGDRVRFTGTAESRPIYKSSGDPIDFIIKKIGPEWHRG